MSTRPTCLKHYHLLRAKHFVAHCLFRATPGAGCPCTTSIHNAVPPMAKSTTPASRSPRNWRRDLRGHGNCATELAPPPTKPHCPHQRAPCTAHRTAPAAGAAVSRAGIEQTTRQQRPGHARDDRSPLGVPPEHAPSSRPNDRHAPARWLTRLQHHQQTPGQNQHMQQMSRPDARQRCFGQAMQGGPSPRQPGLRRTHSPSAAPDENPPCAAEFQPAAPAAPPGITRRRRALPVKAAQGAHMKQCVPPIKPMKKPSMPEPITWLK